MGLQQALHKQSIPERTVLRPANDATSPDRRPSGANWRDLQLSPLQGGV